ncbi:hypothetical protein Cgig2_028196 [Carnegiea gigantea]|uniref:Uncharacterized protein n=1 Tax=Carnegiea gigantea TaxID=171969 RepID=A0A9Q1Q499_9CARY|nr:hypothetical protein Cgig2_028196 [Carnegiea gigantea]
MLVFSRRFLQSLALSLKVMYPIFQHKNGQPQPTKKTYYRLNFTSAMATCSLSTVDSSTESTGASSHDLANLYTNVRLVEASTARKSAAKDRACTEGSPTASDFIAFGPLTPNELCSFVLKQGRPGPQGSGGRHCDRIMPTLGPRSLAGTQVREVQGPHYSDRAFKKEESVSTLHLGRAVKEDKRRVLGYKPSWLALPRACAVLPLELVRSQQQFALPWRSQIQGAIASPALALHKAKKSQVRVIRKAYAQERRQAPLEKCLRMGTPAAAKKSR